MELTSLGFLGGVIFSMTVFAAGVFYGDYQRKHNRVCDDVFHFSHRDGSRGSDHGQDKPMESEEVINGLQCLRMNLSRTEKEYLDYAVECVSKVDELNKYIEGGCHESGD